MDAFDSQLGEGRLEETENVLRVSEERLRLALSAGGMGIFDWDAVCDKLVWSRRHEELWGYAPGEFSGTLAGFTSRVHPEDWPGVEREMEVCRGGEPFAREFRVLWPDGSVHWISSHGEYEFDAAGRPVRMCGVVTDITKRKRAEEEMARNEQRMRLALDAAKAGTWEWNVETGEVFWSEEMWSLFGVTPHSFKPTYEKWRATVHPEDLPALEQRLMQEPRGGVDLEAEWRVQDPDGQIRWVLSRGRLLQAEPGRSPRYIGIVVDITERKRTEEDARRWQQVFEGAQFGLARADLKENRFLEVNTVFATERGYRREELVGRPLLEIYAPEGREEMRERLANIDQRGRLAYEATHVRKDGSRFPVLMEVTVIKDDAGRPVCRVAHAVDITAWKRAEAELRRSEERFNQALHLLREGVIIASATGRMLYWNPAALRMHGMRDPQEGLTSLQVLAGVFELWTVDGERKLARNEWPMPRMLSGEDMRDNEYRLRRLDQGWERIMSYAGTVVQTADAERLVFLMVMDLTEQRRAEAGLRESEEKFRNLADNISQLAWMADERGHVFWHNRRWYEFIGKTAEELRASEWESVHHPDHRERVVERFRSHVASRETWEDTFPLRGKDGKFRWFLSRAVPIYSARGQGVRWFGTNTDITDQLKVEEALRERNEELVRFVDAVSHDLKSPLVTIRTFEGYLERDLEAGNMARVRSDLGYIRNAADKMHQMLEELLELTRIGRKQNPPEELLLQDVVREALALVAGQVAARGVKVEITAVPVRLKGDHQRLVAVFQNLVDNAIKFMGTQSAPRVEVGAEEKASETVLFVRDNGGGFDPRHRKRLFGWFERLHPGISGTGLGLAMVRRILEVHGGRIWADSAGPGHGATFYFTLADMRIERP